jgi:hypothetical protein
MSLASQPIKTDSSIVRSYQTVSNDELTFFSVSLKNNINTLERSIERLNTYYNYPTYFLIVPDREIDEFRSRLTKFQNVVLIRESTILSFEQFRRCVDGIKFSVNADIHRLGWYYQQALKLSFLFDSRLSFPCVMWDADTMPLKKIDFFEGGASLLYGSLAEFHSPYFTTMREVFKVPACGHLAFTIQFFTCTLQERDCLFRSLNSYNSIGVGERISCWIAGNIMRSVVAAHRAIDGSLFSEQELVGISHYLSNSRRQRPIKYMRWNISGYLDERQLCILRMLGFYHITYEKPEFFAPRQTWTGLLSAIVHATMRQEIRKLLHYIRSKNSVGPM